MLGWIIIGVIAVPFIIMAIFLLNGRGAFLIAGYNTMSDDKRAEYDEKALCKAVGWLLLSIVAPLILIPITVQFEIFWLLWLSIGFVTILPFAFVIYANTGNRFRKSPLPGDPDVKAEKKPMTIGKKVGLIIFTLLSVQLLIGIGIMIYQGESDPRVSVYNEGIRIRALYGTEVIFSNVSEITLVPESMAEIGIGNRTNGYATTGQALKGTFQSLETGQQLLFVYSSSSPTIQISMTRGIDIFISFRDSETTRDVYQSIAAAFANS